MYAKKRKPKKEKPRKQKPVSTFNALPHDLRYALAVADHRYMNTFTLYFLSLHDALDWLEEHTPQDIEGCKDAIDSIDDIERLAAKRFSEYGSEIKNKNQTLVYRCFYAPDLPTASRDTRMYLCVP